MNAVVTLLALALPLAAAAQVSPVPPAQTPVMPPSAVVVGRVVDSLVTGRALAGAEIWLDGAPTGAVTDSSGRYRLAGLEPGWHTLGFLHPALDTVGVAAPLVRAELAVVGETRVDLGTPSGATYHTRVCGAPPGEGEGLLAGVVQDAEDERPVAGATVSAAWIEWGVAREGLRRSQRASRVNSDVDGRFALCFVPADVVVEAGAAAGARTSGVVDVELGVRAFAVRRIRVGAPGAAVVTGVVRDTLRRAVPHARVTVAGTQASAQSDSAGAFRLAGVPAGSQTLEVRAVGFAPARLPVVARAAATTHVEATVGRAQVLPTVAVVGRAARPRLDPTGFEDRIKSGQGHYLSQTDIERRNPLVPTDALRLVPGIRVQRTGAGTTRLYIPRGGIEAGGCAPSVFLDGLYLSGAAENLDEWVQVNALRAVEVYPSIATVPAEYRRANSQCGVVLLWTKHGER